MAWEEWNDLKAAAAGRQTAHMKLNGLPEERGGARTPAGGDLRVDQQDLAAIGDSAYRLHTDLIRVGGHARATSVKAAGGLSSDGFALGGALGHVAERWVEQVRSLLDATAHISNHLDFTKGAHAGDEVHIAGTLSSIAQLETGFDERRAN
ncbi:hypothetical protein GCM10017562_54600 [Streptomyces roseofulvus]|uniref:hypothetical protein n=1 Tax=Streptomyces roseofulvus TaxID=33902 RepID=UPI0031FD57A9